MQILHLDDLDKRWREPVHALLAACDQEFVPPLSSRSSTHQSELAPGVVADSDGVSAYFAEMSTQAFVLALSDDGAELLAFLSYIPDYVLPHGVYERGSAYVSTICTAHARRGEGIGRALYESLEQHMSPGAVSLRTWSTNEVQIYILRDRGYAEVLRLPNDRGEGVDTVYFLKEV